MYANNDEDSSLVIVTKRADLGANSGPQRSKEILVSLNRREINETISKKWGTEAWESRRDMSIVCQIPRSARVTSIKAGLGVCRPGPCSL